MNTSWAITKEKVDTAIRRIVETSQPRKLVLFGSFVTGKTHRNSDLDILVVARDSVENPRRESARIRKMLRGLSMPMDSLVVPEGKLKTLATRPDLIYSEALKNGRVVYECPGE